MSVRRADEGVVAFEFSRRIRSSTAPRLGPYESAYETRRGYDAPPLVEVDDREVMLFRGRDARRR